MKMSTASNNPQGMPGMTEIIELARLLRQNGDKVLSATSKLSLSTSLLNDLNEAFTLIVDQNEDLESSFQVCNSSKTDIFRDLKFLHDFVQKTISLKITHRQNEPMTSIDISKFRHLRYLELQKVSIESLRGLQGIRGQLENIVCAGGRGVGSVGRLLAACGGDAGVGFVWGSLRSLTLPYNALVRVDKSLELAPWLQTLDLSHNLISTAGEIDCLPNLKNINLGYNKLEAIPTFSKPVFHTLQVLVLKNNYIDNLSGLQGLESLSELDLSYNCLTEHSILWPLETMSVLLWISLEGNPLAYHPRHRQFSVKHLHPSVADSKFVLDHMPLCKSEKQLVSENRFFSIRSTRSASGDDISSLISSMRSDVTSTSTDTTIFNESMMESQDSDFLESSIRGTRIRRKRNVKEAVIADDDHDKKEAMLSSSVTSNIEVSTEHLEIKEQIAALREKFGKNDWLHSQGGTCVQDIMGLQRPSGPLLSSTPALKTPANTPITTSVYDSSSLTLESSSSLSDRSLEILEEQKFMEQDKDNEESEDADDEKDEDTPQNNHSVINELQESKNVASAQSDPDEDHGDVYLVKKTKIGDDTEELFLVVTSEEIKERNLSNAKVQCRWATNTILSCVMGRGETTTVNIIFDTAKRDRQNRTYFMEPNDAKQLVAIVGETINARPITLKVYKCMKCSTHFSEDVDYSTMTSVFAADFKGPKCPTCRSNLVIQTDELPTPEVEKGPFIKGKESVEAPQEQSSETSRDLDLHHSESHSSIGGTESDMNTVPSSMVYFDFHSRTKAQVQVQVQVQCSATSLDGSRESTPSTGTVTKKYESDIEILSNPSQSSIEVLDENSKSSLTPSRKRSSEERRIAVAPTLLTIPDIHLLPAGLTESSSSGSLTDSVCTTIENKAANSKLISRTLNGNETSMLIEEKEQTPQPVNNLSSMLGGLLESMKIGTSKISSPMSETDAAFAGSAVHYSYTDYSSVDHRVKLHIILNIFEHQREELVLLLRAEILAKDMVKTFPGCLVLSTSKVYLLRITGSEGEDPQKWLHKESSWTMDRLRNVAPLPFKQGILIDFYQPGKVGEVSSKSTILCILQDFQRTSNFLSYLTDLPLPGSCEVEFSVPPHCTVRLQNLLQSSKNHQNGDAVRLLALFTCCTIKCGNQTVITKVAGLLVTMSALLVIEDNMQWLIAGSKERPAIKTEQAMSNLIEVEHNGTSLTLNYLDDVADTEQTWILDFVSPIAVETVINSIRPPWEDLFSVPLQVTTINQENTQKI